MQRGQDYINILSHINRLRKEKAAGRIMICLLCVLFLTGSFRLAAAVHFLGMTVYAEDGGGETGGSTDPSGEGIGSTDPSGGNAGEISQGGTENPQPGGETGTGSETETETETETEKESETESESETEKASEAETESEVGVGDNTGTTDVTSTTSNVVLRAMLARVPAGKLVVRDGEVRYELADGNYLKDAWVKIGAGIYHFEKDGAATTGMYELGKHKYYFDDSGKLYINKFLKTGEDKYFFGDDGRMVTNEWVKATRTRRYYALNDGMLARSMWVKERYFDESGLYSYRKGTLKTSAYDKSTAKRKLIIVGASRSWHMQMAVGKKKGIIWIVSPGKNINWMNGTAVPRLRQKLKKYPNSQVVIQMGNNDVKHHKADAAFAKYRALYNSLMKKYKNAKFYFMDILPMKDLNCRRNRRALEFNKLLRKTFPRQWIGGYDYLMETGYTNSYDGVHYNVDTCRKIFNYILKQIR